MSWLSFAWRPRVAMRVAVGALCACASPVVAAQFDPGEEPPYAAALLLEAETGTVLFEHNADTPRSPASTLKLLLQLVVMEAIEQGRYSLDEEVTTSAWASRMGGSQVFLKQGEVFPLSELMAAIAISSANDACVAVAEHIGGSVDGFVGLMNTKAGQLGLTNTRAVNVHGLDDTPRAEGNETTAHDLAVVAQDLIHYPDILDWSSTRIRPFRDGKFTLYTTNKLLGRFRGLDGLKTGHTARAGFNLVATAQRQDMRLVSVVLGSRSDRARDQASRELLSWGFNHFSKTPITLTGDSLGTVVMDWGIDSTVTAVTTDSVIAVLTPEQRRRIEKAVQLPELREAPIAAGDSIGVLQLKLDDRVLASLNLVAATSVERMSLWEKLVSYF